MAENNINNNKNAFQNSFIQDEYNKNKSNYNNVNQFAYDNYTNLDQAYTKALNEMNPAYDELSNEIYNNMQNTQKEYDYYKTLAKNEWKDSKKTAYKDYLTYKNKSGVLNDRNISSGLANSGYSDTVQSYGYKSYQQNLSELQTTLNKKINDYNTKAAQAMQEGNVELAQLNLQKKREGMQLFLEISGQLNSLANKIQEMNESEKNFAYQQEQDRINNKIQEDNQEINEKNYILNKKNSELK